MGAGASRKKKKNDVPKGDAEKPSVWVDVLDLEPAMTHGLAYKEPGNEGLGGGTYTGLTQMGLARLKPHLVGKLVYTAEPAQNHDEALDDAADPATESSNEIVRVPSGASAKSKWSVVKSSATLASAVKANHMKVEGNGANTEFRRVPSSASQQKSLGTNKQFKRVPSNASQQKSVKSHWSDLKSRVSHGSLPEQRLKEKISSWVYVGEFFDGKKHGLGVETHEDGRVYEGEWQAGEMHGWGVLTRKDGSVYRGQFEKGVMCGKGAEVIVSSEQDHGYQDTDPTKLFLSFEGVHEDGRREGRGLSGRARSSDALSVMGLVRINVVKYTRGALVPADTVPLTEAKSKYASLVKEQMDAWIEATFIQQKADQLQTMVQTLLINKVRENSANPDASSDEEPSQEMTDEERSEEMVKIYAKIKELSEMMEKDEARKKISGGWQSYESAQYDVEMEALRLQKERKEAEERARQLEKERQEALERLKKAQDDMDHAKSVQLEAMAQMKEAKALKARAQQARDDKKLWEIQLVAFKEAAVITGHMLQTAEEKEQETRQSYNETDARLKEAEAQLATCEANLAVAERRVKRLTQEYELGHDQLRIQAANCLTFHQVKEVFQKYDADGSGELERDEIKLALTDLGLPNEGTEVDRFIQQLDTDCTGTLNWSEFQQLARQSEETKGVQGHLVKNATEIEKELFAAMNNAISSMIACNSNLVAAQLKVKSSQINFKEKQENLERSSASLLECQLAEESATGKQQTAEIKLKSLVQQIVSLEETSSNLARDASESAAKGSMLWETASAALEAAQRGEKEVQDMFADEAERLAAMEEARKRALDELSANVDDDALQKQQESDAARIEWLKEYPTPQDEESKKVMLNGVVIPPQAKLNGVEYVYPDRRAKYCGEWRNGVRWGQGKFILYRSALPRNATVLFSGEQVPEEPGGLCLGEKATYDGLWVDDLPDGLGVMIDPYRGYYQGAWKRGMRQGNGTFRDATGNVYKGRWQENSKNGKGVETMANGEIFDGEFQSSLRHGKGTSLRGETYKHVGTWRRGKMHGKGTLEDDGLRYKGDFRNGERTGKGNVQYGELLEYQGELVNGKRQGNGIMLFEDDRKYNGEWVLDEMKGYGVLTYVNGDEYNGPFEDGKRHGPKGSLEIQELEGCSATYIGDFCHDRMEGKAVVTWVDGRKYEGQFQDGIRNGQGVMTYTDGSTYDGNWIDGACSGTGILTFSDGTKYTGLFQNNIRHGRGTLEKPNGDKCSGEFRADKMHGKGVYIYADGSEYQGEFIDGLICGRGEYKDVNGRSYVGEWANNMREGRGDEVDEGGRRYSGFFHNDLKHGNGTIKWPNDRCYEGMWTKGEKHGWGKERIPADMYGKAWTEYEGEFRMGREKIGLGKFVSANGDVYDGQWENQMRHGHGHFKAADGYEYEGQWNFDKKSGIGKEKTTARDIYQGEFYNDTRHGMGTEINVKGDQYIGEFFRGTRSGEGKSFDNSTSSRYEGEFVNDLQHGFGKSVSSKVVDGQSTWITYEGEWKDAEKHGEGIETDCRDLSESKTFYFLGKQKPSGKDEELFFRNPSLTLSVTSKEDSDAINEILMNLHTTMRDHEEREEWICRLEIGLSDANEQCSAFRQQVLEHNGVPIICELLRDDTDDMAQLKGGQLLFFMSKTVDFAGMARAVVESPDAVKHIVALLHEENTEPRIYACGILQALCKEEDFARLTAGEGAVTKLVKLVRNPGWITIIGKGLAARALKNIGHHQRAVVALELGLSVATGGFGYDSQKNEIERRNIEEAIRKILIATNAAQATTMLD